MDQKPSENQNQGWIRKNKGTLIMLAIIAAIGIIYFVTRDQNSENQTSENSSETTQDQSQGDNSSSTASENQDTQNQNETTETNGDVTASGLLLASNDPTRGNLMVQTDKLNVYVATKRNYSGLLGKQVVLSAMGSLESFTLLDLREGNTGEVPAVGGPENGQVEGETTGEVRVSGVLEKSQRTDLGNYQIVSAGQDTVYLQSMRDYSALLGSQVELVANGSLKSFTNARLIRK